MNYDTWRKSWVCEQIWFRRFAEKPCKDIQAALEELYSRGAAFVARRVGEILGVGEGATSPDEFFELVNKEMIIRNERSANLARELDVARAWADYFKASHHSGYYLEEQENAEEAKAINAAEERLLQLGINPSEEEPSWKR